MGGEEDGMGGEGRREGWREGREGERETEMICDLNSFTMVTQVNRGPENCTSLVCLLHLLWMKLMFHGMLCFLLSEPKRIPLSISTILLAVFSKKHES